MEDPTKTLDEILEGLSQGEVDYLNFQLVGEQTKEAEPEAEVEAVVAAQHGNKQPCPTTSRFQAVSAEDIDIFLSNLENQTPKEKLNRTCLFSSHFCSSQERGVCRK